MGFKVRSKTILSIVLIILIISTILIISPTLAKRARKKLKPHEASHIDISIDSTTGELVARSRKSGAEARLKIPGLGSYLGYEVVEVDEFRTDTKHYFENAVLVFHYFKYEPHRVKWDIIAVNDISANWNAFTKRLDKLDIHIDISDLEPYVERNRLEIPAGTVIDPLIYVDEVSNQYVFDSINFVPSVIVVQGNAVLSPINKPDYKKTMLQDWAIQMWSNYNYDEVSNLASFEFIVYDEDGGVDVLEFFIPDGGCIVTVWYYNESLGKYVEAHISGDTLDDFSLSSVAERGTTEVGIIWGSLVNSFNFTSSYGTLYRQQLAINMNSLTSRKIKVEIYIPPKTTEGEYEELTLTTTISPNDTIIPHLKDWYMNGIWNRITFDATNDFKIQEIGHNISIVTEIQTPKAYNDKYQYLYAQILVAVCPSSTGQAHYGAVLGLHTHNLDDPSYPKLRFDWRVTFDKWFTLEKKLYIASLNIHVVDANNSDVYLCLDDSCKYFLKTVTDSRFGGTVYSGLIYIGQREQDIDEFIGFISYAAVYSGALLKDNYLDFQRGIIPRVDKLELFSDPMIYNSTHYINIVNTSQIATASVRILRVAAQKPRLWLLSDLATDNYVHFKYFPSGSIIEIYDSSNNLVMNFTISGTTNAAGLVEDYLVDLPSGTYTIRARFKKSDIGRTCTYVLDSLQSDLVSSIWIEYVNKAVVVAPKIPPMDSEFSVIHPLTDTELHFVVSGSGDFKAMYINGTLIPSKIIPMKYLKNYLDIVIEFSSEESNYLDSLDSCNLTDISIAGSRMSIVLDAPTNTLSLAILKLTTKPRDILLNGHSVKSLEVTTLSKLYASEIAWLYDWSTKTLYLRAKHRSPVTWEIILGYQPVGGGPGFIKKETDVLVITPSTESIHRYTKYIFIGALAMGIIILLLALSKRRRR